MNDDVKNNFDLDPGINKEDVPSNENELAKLDQQVQIESLSLTIEKLETELKETKSKAEENWNLLLRAKAEVENVRRRAQLDIEKAHKFGMENFTRELIHVADSLDKGLEIQYTGEASQAEAMLQGMQLTHKLFIDTLEKFGIKEINPLGEAFDPSKHEAISMQESSDVEPNKILIVIQKGFTVYERVLRPARVIVAQPVTSAAKTDKPKEDEKA